MSQQGQDQQDFRGRLSTLALTCRAIWAREQHPHKKDKQQSPTVQQQPQKHFGSEDPLMPRAFFALVRWRSFVMSYKL
jgi:hypothetical protein